MKKRAMSVLLAAAMAAGMMTGCGGNSEAPSENAADGVADHGDNTDAADDAEKTSYKVAVVKQMDHASLDEIANAVCEELDAIAASNGITIEYEVQSGQGEQSVLNQIGTQVISDEVDVIIPIATLAAQVMATCAEETKTPIVYAAISDVEKTANTNDEVIAAASTLMGEKVDAVFTPTDNVIMSAELAIYEDLAAAGIPHYTGADSFVRNGAFITCGVNYTDLGHETADLAYRALTEGMDGLEDYYLMDGGIITVNTETAEALGIDYAVFAEMGDIVEVTTTEE